MLLSDAHTAALAEAFPFAGYPNHSDYDRGVERLTLSPGKPPATFSDPDHTYPHDERHTSSFIAEAPMIEAAPRVIMIVKPTVSAYDLKGTHCAS